MLVNRSVFIGMVAVFSLNTTLIQANEQGVIRHPVAHSNVPVSAAVEVPASASLVYLSGKLPPLIDSSQPSDSPLAYGGNTKGQTVAVLTAIEKTLADLGLTLGDVIKMQVFLVGDPALDNKMDLAGFTEGYAMFFGAQAQSNLPARTLMQVSGLANKAFLVEIDVIAVRRN
ncbi:MULTISPECIES: RidA family protein [unclassified Pseudomonas]|uniref:RidA family protein n=1 Tax=unclassified Pseudomonas TaxID=196821 RepID=UPI0021146229|nr:MULTISPECIES: RidA family protein [unclassified Pseudomonas]